jgi:hypothetical protein
VKRFASAVLQLYFAIGGLLGAIVLASYVLGPALQLGVFWWFSSWAAFSGFTQILLAGLVSQIVRTLLWLPSLVIWYFSESSVSFGQWLAPGFYSGMSN